MYQYCLLYIVNELNKKRVTNSKNDSMFIYLVPENCSEMFRQLILSLFITHTDCNLNKTGRLIVDTSYQQYAFRGYWCSNLVRRPSSSLI